MAYHCEIVRNFPRLRFPPPTTIEFNTLLLLRGITNRNLSTFLESLHWALGFIGVSLRNRAKISPIAISPHRHLVALCAFEFNTLLSLRGITNRNLSTFLGSLHWTLGFIGVSLREIVRNFPRLRFVARRSGQLGNFGTGFAICNISATFFRSATASKHTAACVFFILRKLASLVLMAFQKCISSGLLRSFNRCFTGTAATIRSIFLL